MSSNFYDPRDCPNCFESACFLADPGTGNVCCSLCGYIDEAETHRNLTIDYSSNGWAIPDPFDVQAGPSRYDEDKVEQAFKNSVKSLIKDWLSTIARLKHLEGDLSDFVESAMGWYLKVRHAELLDTQTRRAKALDKRRKKAFENAENQPANPRPVNYAHQFHAVKIPYHVAVAIRLALQESHLIVLYARIERALGEEEADRARPPALGQWAVGGGKAPILTLQELFDSTKHVPGDLSVRLTSFPFLRASYRRFAKLLSSHMSSQDAVLCNVIDHIEWIRSLMLMTFEDRLALFKSTDTLGGGKEKIRASKWTKDDFAYLEGLPWDDLLPLAYKFWRAQACVNLWSGAAHRGGAAHNYSIALVCWCITAIRRKPMTNKKGIPPIAHELAALYDATFYSASAKFNELQRLLVCWATTIPDLVDQHGRSVPWPSMEVSGTSRSQANEAGTGFSGWKSDSRRQIPEFHITASIALTVAEHWQQIATIRQTRPAVVPFEEELAAVRKLVAQHAIPAKPKRAKLPRGQRKPKVSKKAQKRAELDRSSVDTATSLEVTTPVMVPSPGPSTASSSASSTSASTDKHATFEQVSPQVGTLDIGPPTPPRNHQTLDYASHQSFPPTPRAAPSNTRNFWSGSIPASVEELLRNPEDSSDEEPADSDDEEASLRKAPRSSRREAGSVGAGFSLGPDGLQKLDIPLDPRWITPSLPPGGSPVGMRFKPTPRLRVQPAPPSSVAMSRSGSSSSSQSSQTGASEITTYSATTLHSVGSVFPSSSRTSREASAFADGEIRPLSEYVPKDPFFGCLVREREQYYVKRIPKAEAAQSKFSNQLHAIMREWIEEQKVTGSIPDTITPAYLVELGLPSSPTPADVGTWAARMKEDRDWSPCEAWLRAGRAPSEIPAWHMPTSITSLKADLYRLESGLRPIGHALSDAELDMEMRVLFDECGENDSAATQFLTADEAKHREWIYAQAGILDQLTEASTKALERVIRGEEADAADRIAREESAEALGRGIGKRGRKRKRKPSDLAAGSMLQSWNEGFVDGMEVEDEGEGEEEGSLAWYTGGSLQRLLELSGQGSGGGKSKGRKRVGDDEDGLMDGLEAFGDEKEDDDYESYWNDDKTDEPAKGKGKTKDKEKKEKEKSKRAKKAKTDA